jgi:uncharacterized phage-like protein YoqJ
MTDKSQELIQIAVTGHRFINVNNKLTASIQEVLTKIIRGFPGTDFYLLSALAEGSDQLVARIALKNREIKLIVPLPLPEERYVLDFHTADGRNTFNQIIKNATRVITLTNNDDHDLAYDYLGNYLVEQSDILLTIWNGEISGKQGSTGEVVKKAMNAGKPIYWIYCDNGNDGSVNNLSKEKEVGEIEVINRTKQYP